MLADETNISFGNNPVGNMFQGALGELNSNKQNLLQRRNNLLMRRSASKNFDTIDMIFVGMLV